MTTATYEPIIRSLRVVGYRGAEVPMLPDAVWSIPVIAATGAAVELVGKAVPTRKRARVASGRS